VLVIGVKESSKFNDVMVLTKVAILIFFVIVGAFYVKPANWHPFAPSGWAGIGSGAALIFFAYIGFDAVSTAAEECRNPQRDMPIGLLGSLGICSVLYIATALVLTGIVPLSQIQGSSEPLAKAFSLLGMNWAAGVVAFGAVIATTAVLLVFQYGQPRIFFSMARDGLLPPSFARIHPKYRTPHITTIWTGVVVAVLAAVANLDVFVELTNIGTLFAFVLVCAGVMILRYRDPGRPRPFRTPLVPYVPIAGILICVYLMKNLPLATWIRFAVWLAVGLVLYFFYGYRHSRFGSRGNAGGSDAAPVR
jgi:APA family basic amino acid/polyamine antiporter